jgi:hypothetical protein
MHKSIHYPTTEHNKKPFSIKVLGTGTTYTTLFTPRHACRLQRIELGVCPQIENSTPLKTQYLFPSDPYPCALEIVKLNSNRDLQDLRKRILNSFMKFYLSQYNLYSKRLSDFFTMI